MILVFGRNGQVAAELCRHQNVVALGRDICDLEVTGKATEAISNIAPTAVVNVAAYTAVDAAEQDTKRVRSLDFAAPIEIAISCVKKNIPLMHNSTDHVFDGSGTQPWKPDDTPSPQSEYGRSKLADEQAVKNARGIYVILRTAWVFSAQGQNFVKTMLRLGAQKEGLSVVCGQIGGPACAADIAHTCLNVLPQLADNTSKSGVYHFSGDPNTSWADFARERFFQSKINCKIVDISTEDYPTPARRPKNSRFDYSDFEKAFSSVRPNWKLSLAKTLREISDAT